MDLKEFDALLHDAEVKMKRLKALYEQWFQGIERLEPSVARKDLERLFSILNKEKPRNTAARFRLQQLVARYSIYTTYWGRIARQIEEGTYERDVRRVQRNRGMAATRAAAKEYELDLDEDVDLDDADLFGADEIASVLTALEAQPAPAPKPVLSAFSSFAMKKGPPTAKQAAAPKADAAAPQTAKQPAAPRAEPAAPAAGPTTSTFKKPTVATFGRPQVTCRTPRARAPRPRRPGRRCLDRRPRAPPRRGPRAARVGGRPARAERAAAEPGRPPSRGGAAIGRASVGASPPRPSAQGEETQLRHLYDRYVDARRRNNERVDNLAYDKVAASVQQMASKLREKHGNKKIDFEVVVQDGKVGIKPKIG
ncbi:MAG: hypothetical protein M5U28_15280 [Sandaracinaceae bacterium]|nr:hypothetical protein [Sandaracinaceae bacterium]